MYVSRNIVILFMVNRYVCYALLFIRGILIAKFLGPYLYGVWSFLTLVQQYLSSTSLGLHFAVNVELSTGVKLDSLDRKHIISTSLTLNMLISLVVCVLAFALSFSDIKLLSNYPGYEYLVPVTIIAGLTNIQQLLVNIYRSYEMLNKIVFSELFLAVLTLFVVFLFEDRSLIFASLVAMILATSMNLAVFLINPPFPMNVSIDVGIAKRLLIIGIPLLVYNFSFILITMIGRTIVGLYYSIEEMGIYSFANVISGTAMLAVESVAWILFPAILSKIHQGVDNEIATMSLNKVRDFFGTSVFVTVFIIILFLPILFHFVPSYRPAQGILNILLLSQAVLSISFGYNCLAIARKKQNIISIFSLVTVIAISCMCLLVASFGLSIKFIAVSILIGTLFFVILQGYLGHYLLHGVWRANIKTIFPLSNLVAILLFLFGELFSYSVLLHLIGLTVFIAGNVKQLRDLYQFCLVKCFPSKGVLA